MEVCTSHVAISGAGWGGSTITLLAGPILIELGMDGPVAVERLRERRPGALFNERFADYLASVKGR